MCLRLRMLNQTVIHEFGLRIKQLRTEKNISQEKLSFETGLIRLRIIQFSSQAERSIKRLKTIFLNS